MEVEYKKARNGAPTVLFDHRFLHSRYDPGREAVRFVETVALDHPDGIAILIGDGTGIVRGALQDRFPGLRIVSIEPIPEQRGFIETHVGNIPDRIAVAPDDLSSFRATIRGRIHPLETGAIQQITWPGARTALPAWTPAVQKSVLNAIHDLRAELATIASFGRLWISNTLRQTMMQNVRVEVRFSGEQLVIAAAGPGLSALTQWIPPGDRENLPVIAAGSALCWLKTMGFRPALAVHTDGGIWAARYLRDSNTTTTIATVVRATPNRNAAPMLFRTGWFGEELVADSHTWPTLREQPTVGASLIELAHTLSPAARFIVSGLDLCTRDLVGHCRPHRNDRYINALISRLQTDETIRAFRAGLAADARHFKWDDGAGAWQSQQLEAYRAPVAASLERHRADGCVSFLKPSPIWTDEPDHPLTKKFPSGRFTHATIIRPKEKVRRRRATETLHRWREQVSKEPARASLSAIEKDLLLHLAPVEALQWYRDRISWDTVAMAACNGINRWLAMLEKS